MTLETETKVALVMAVVRSLQISGDLPQPGQISYERIARLSKDLGETITAATLRRYERIGTAKLRHTLQACLESES